MMNKNLIYFSAVLIIISSFFCVRTDNKNGKNEFVLIYSEEVSDKPITGRALIILSPDTLVDPDIPDPYRPFITIGMDFKDWASGEELIMNSGNTDSFLSGPDELEGDYSLRVLLNPDTAGCIIYEAGFFYSEMHVIHVDPDRPGKFIIPVGNTYPGVVFTESERVRLMTVRSELLSGFYGYDRYIEAAVILPESYYSDTVRYYPVVYVFPGFGSSHLAASVDDFQEKRYGMAGYGEEKIFVFMNQECRYGFHVFADSENNGPRATSFIDEFIPQFESEYRAFSDPEARFLTGQSSGGWAALWLLVNYPEMFGMVWSGSPDPVDFRDFIGHNLYAREASMYYGMNGQLTASMRGEGAGFSNKDWAMLESAMGDGGQYQSFEAVFSKKGKDGKPEQMFDRETGLVDKDVINHWKRYDINRIVSGMAEDLRPVLDNKINIVVSENDDFFLDGAVKLFNNTLDSLGIQHNILLLHDGGHNTWTDAIRTNMHTRFDSIFHLLHYRKERLFN